LAAVATFMRDRSMPELSVGMKSRLRTCHNTIGTSPRLSPKDRDVAAVAIIKVHLQEFGWSAKVITVACTLKRHFANIIASIRKPITNAGAESLNSKIR
jgi:Transposase